MTTDQAEEMFRYIESARSRTRRVIDCIPPDRLEWRPAEGAFSFGDLIRHLAAIERWTFAENARLRPSRYAGHGIEVTAGHADTLAYFEAMHEEAMEIVRGLGPEDLEARCVTPGGTRIRVWKWLRSMIEHEVHHRGQIYLMLRMIGVATPPMYGLTSEQVRANSIQQATSSDA